VNVMRKVGNLSLLLLLFGLSFFVALRPEEERYVPVIQKVMPSSVAIYVEGRDFGAPMYIMGSGVFVSTSGHILTCAHLFTDMDVKLITVEDSEGYVLKADFIYMSEKMDLALIRVHDHTVPIRLADPRRIRVGQEVLAIGSPAGLTFSVSAGIISGLNRDFPWSYNSVQSDTAINPGNSGGPLFNLKGELIGINSFLISPNQSGTFSGLGFSVEAGECLKFLTRCRKLDRSLNFKWGSK
jgi:serine protease Do